MTTWDELLKNRTLMPTLRSSAHMLKCSKAVLAKHPGAKIVPAGKNLWKLEEEGQALSNAHTSHYACWAEAKKVMEQVS